MPNAQVHLIAGTFSSLVIAFILYKLAHIGFPILMLGIAIGIIASEFPDIDHPNSLPRKILKGVMPALIFFLFIYLFFSLRIWNYGFILASSFFILPILAILTYEHFIPKHRGATHKWPGIAFLVGLTIPFSLATGFNLTITLSLILFALSGFFTHVVLDSLK